MPACNNASSGRRTGSDVTRDYADRQREGNYLGGLRVDKSGICEITKWLAIQIEFVMRGWSRIAS